MTAVAERLETDGISAEVDALLASPELEGTYHDEPLTGLYLIVSPPLPRAPKKK